MRLIKQKFTPNDSNELVICCENNEPLDILGSKFEGFSKVIIRGTSEVNFYNNIIINVGGIFFEGEENENSSCFMAGNQFFDCDGGVSISDFANVTIQKNSFTRVKDAISMKNVKNPIVTLNECIYTKEGEKLDNCGEVKRPCFDQLLMRRETPLSFTKRELPEGFSAFTFHRDGDERMSMDEYIENWFKVCPHWNKDSFNLFYYDGRIPDDGYFLILDENGEAVAHSNVQLNEHEEGSATVHFVEVSENVRGKKLGYCVSELVLEYVQDHNIPVTFLTTDEFRMSAIKIYWNLGFRPVYYNEDVKKRWEPIIEILET